MQDYILRPLKVRNSHAALNGAVRDLADSPDPGEEFNCRCRAEPVNEAQGLRQEVISDINDAHDKWDTFDFGWHFYTGGGQGVTLPQIGYLRDIIDKAREVMFKNVQEQVADKMREIKSGPLTYTTENSYDRLGEVHWVLGGGTIRTLTRGVVTKDGNILSIVATVKYEYFDEVTDIADIREALIGTSSTKNPEFEDYKWTEFGGTAYPITGNWETKLTGSVKLKEKLSEWLQQIKPF
ncbi:MAG: hypothetical protein H6853_01760 [Rhodospirillales bacterium]|nr:MAG: hypothetical protein H6853_01760 [Rhodospirillales bacterium]